MDSFDWNDLRFVLAVTRAGSAAAAARALGVSHATVLRRITALEQGVGAPLFERHASGFLANDAGRRLAEVGESIESTLIDTSRAIDAESNALQGTIRFTTTDSFAVGLVPQLLAEFHRSQPAIQVEMLVTNARLDLDRREADVTLRASRNPPLNWVGMRAARFDFAVYAATSYVAARPGQPWQAYDWVWPGGPMAATAAVECVRAEVGDLPGVASADSFVGLRELAAAGLGATVLPCFFAHGDPRLTLVHPLPEDTSSELWVLTHPHLRQMPRIKVFMESLAQGVRARQQMLLLPKSQGYG